MKERKRRSVLQSARADGDGMRRPPEHLITGGDDEKELFFGLHLRHQIMQEVDLFCRTSF